MVRFDGLSISSLLFVDGAVLMAYSSCVSQLSLERFTAECEAVRMKISNSKSETMDLSWMSK